MSDKDKNPLLDKWTKTETSLLLTSGLIKGQNLSKLDSTGNAGLLKTSLALENKNSLSTTTSSLLKPALNNPLLSSFGLGMSPSLLSSPFSSSSKTTSSDLINLPLKSTLLASNLTKLSLKPTKYLSSNVEKQCLRSSEEKSSSQKRCHGSTLQTVKKAKQETESGVLNTIIIKKYSVEAPDYYIKSEKVDEYVKIKLPKFIPLSQDTRLLQSSTVDINALKRGFINLVSGSLIAQPNFDDPNNDTRNLISGEVLKILKFDPEFVLKVALYSRKELNIRSTSNFLLALAARHESCRVFLKKYFSSSVALPSDWIQVAEFFQTLENEKLKPGALPTALRKAMISKFIEFDEYQLAKYNKEGSIKKKKAKDKKKKMFDAKAATSTEMEVDDENDKSDEDSSDDDDYRRKFRKKKKSELEIIPKKKLTMKYLIRKLHMRDPSQYVMSILGKKYPSTREEFLKSRLPGTWEEERAGKRMKLTIPETWETQVSLKGNKAKTWEDLIDHRKLPYMAMLRNLRNLIKAGISDQHHNFVLRRLCDQKAVINSKQFPFRFFSAYTALTQLEEAYEENQNKIIKAAEEKAALEKQNLNWGISKIKAGKGARGRGHQGRGMLSSVRGGVGRGRGRGKGQKAFPWWILKKQKKEAKEGIKEVPYDTRLIQRYKKALDTAVKVATVHNVPPIKGRTILLIEDGPEMEKMCQSAKGLGSPKKLRDIALLMGLMCKHNCEHCDLMMFSNIGYKVIELTSGTILDNMEKINSESWKPFSQIDRHKKIQYYNISPIFDFLVEKLRDRIQIDNLLVFGENFTPTSYNIKSITNFLQHYRLIVNPNILFVSVSFSGKPGITDDKRFTHFYTEKEMHPNNVFLSGYSDSILKFIAERGNSALVTHVDRIDSIYQLIKTAKFKSRTPQDHLLPLLGNLQLSAPTPCWKTLRVFISSTFRDMHGERDLLTRFIFPELRSYGRKHFINIHEVDLRWGLTEEDTKDNRTLDICLREVKRCELFVGLLGERYGWTPSNYQVPDTPEFDWVREYPSGASVTELEMYCGALGKVQSAKDTAFFFFRDNTFEQDLPVEFEKEFKSESDVHKAKISALKNKIRHSGLEVYDGYPCHWGGCVDGKPIVAGLNDFGARVLNCLINAVDKLCPNQEEAQCEEDHIHNLQWSYIENLNSDFIGRQSLVTQIIHRIKSKASGVIGLVGKPGSGKSALLAKTINQYVDSAGDDGYISVLFNIPGSAPGSCSLSATLRRMFLQINKRFGLGQTLPEDFKNLILKLREMLEDAAALCASKLVLFMDGIDMMDASNQPFTLDWLPLPVPENVIIVVSAVEGEKTHKSLKRLDIEELNIGGLDMWDKAEIVRKTLAKHRKNLDESGFGNQMKLLMLKKDAHNPLYLKLACEELRVFGVFEKISEKLKNLPQTTSQMLQEILNRLEQDHGRELVCAALSFLACARDGLYPEELHELLSWHNLLAHEKFEPQDIVNRELNVKDILPQLSFSYLTRSIMSFLNPSSDWAPVLSLANQEICTAVRLRYLKNLANASEIKLHKLLAGYYLKQADPLNNNSWQSQVSKAFSELPFHLANAGNFETLENVLCNHKFINAKCILGMAVKLMDDFTPKVLSSNAELEKNLSKFLSRAQVEQYKSFVSRNIEVLVSYPALEWQQALNEPSDTFPYMDAASCDLAVPHMIWLNKPEKRNQCYMTKSNFKFPITCVALSTDGSKLATGSQDTLVRLYEMATGKELQTFTGHSNNVTDICFVDKSLLCSASMDTTLCIWHAEHGHRIQTLKGHDRSVSSCTSNKKGNLVVSGGWDCFVFVWKPTNGEKICDLNIGSPVNSVDFHPEDELIVVGSWDSLIRIYNYFHKTRIAIIRGHNTSIRDIAYSVDGKHLASAALDGDIKIWSADKGSQVGTVKGHCGPVSRLTFSPNGKELITAGEDHQIKVWSGELGVPVHKISSGEMGAAVSVAISPDGESVAIGYHLGVVQLCSLLTGGKIFTTKLSPCAVRGLKFSTSGDNILCGSDDSTVQIISSEQGTKVTKLTGHTKPVLCIDTCGSFITTGGEDFTCCVYENVEKLKKNRESKPAAVLRGHLGPVTSCSISADTTWLVTASRDQSVRMYRLKDALIINDLQPHKVLSSCHADWINAAQWSNIGDFLVTASNDFNLKIWNMENGTEKLVLTGHTSAVNCVAYKHGCIVSGSSDGNVKVWSHKGVPITTLTGHILRVNACDILVQCKGENYNKYEEEKDRSWAEISAMEVDDEIKKPAIKDVNLQDVIVVSAGDDGDVWIWKPLQTNNIACLAGHSDRVLSVDVDRDRHIASSSLDHSVRLWQPQLNEANSTLKHNGPVTFLSVCSNWALSGSRDGVVKIWKRESKNLFQLKHSYQAHDKSVNCGIFESTSTCDKFVTGGDDCTVNIWEIVEHKDAFLIRKLKKWETSYPVASVSSAFCDGQFFYSTWRGDIYVGNFTSLQVKIFRNFDVHETTREDELYWAQSLLVDKTNSGHLIAGYVNGFIQLMDINAGLREENDSMVDVVNVSLEEKLGSTNWLNCLASLAETLLAGDSHGHIFIEKERKIIKIHQSAVTSIQIKDNWMFTSSLDCVIKVWNVHFKHILHLTQVGQFICPAPIWSMQIVSSTTVDGKLQVYLLAGDQMGHVHQLLWKS